jgi:hypothetical protein
MIKEINYIITITQKGKYFNHKILAKPNIKRIKNLVII